MIICNEILNGKSLNRKYLSPDDAIGMNNSYQSFFCYQQNIDIYKINTSFDIFYIIMLRILNFFLFFQMLDIFTSHLSVIQTVYV